MNCISISLELTPSEEESLTGYLAQHLDESGRYYDQDLYRIYERLLAKMEDN